MTTIARFLNGISYGLDRICRVSSAGFFAAMLLMVLFQILARYIVRVVPVWTDEASRYFMIWGGLLGATVAFRSGSDPRLTHPPRKGPRLWIVTAGLLRASATVIFLGPVLYHCDTFLARNWQRQSAAIGIPMAFVTIAVPIFIIVLLVHLSARLVNPAGPEGTVRNTRSTESS